MLPRIELSLSLFALFQHQVCHQTFIHHPDANTSSIHMHNIVTISTYPLYCPISDVLNKCRNVSLSIELIKYNVRDPIPMSIAAAVQTVGSQIKNTKWFYTKLNKFYYFTSTHREIVRDSTKIKCASTSKCECFRIISRNGRNNSRYSDNFGNKIVFSRIGLSLYLAVFFCV